MADTDTPKQAFISDNALVLYFDNAVTPFVARFDLDALVQANFEVADKKDGTYSLTLRDFSGETQQVGLFTGKTDAHQALYAILQALLSHNERKASTVSEKRSGVLHWVGRLIKILLIFIGCVTVLYYVLSKIPVPVQQNGMAPQTMSDAPAPSSVTPQAPQQNPLAELPQGESIDADQLLLQQATPPQEVPAQDTVPSDAAEDESPSTPAEPVPAAE